MTAVEVTSPDKLLFPAGRTRKLDVDRLTLETEMAPQLLPVAEIEAVARNAGVDLDT